MTDHSESCEHSVQHHVDYGCDEYSMPPLADDRTAMMLGLVPDKRTPLQRLLDAIDTDGKLLSDD